MKRLFQGIFAEKRNIGAVLSAKKRLTNEKIAYKIKIVTRARLPAYNKTSGHAAPKSENTYGDKVLWDFFSGPTGYGAR